MGVILDHLVVLVNVVSINVGDIFVIAASKPLLVFPKSRTSAYHRERFIGEVAVCDVLVKNNASSYDETSASKTTLRSP